MLAEGDEHCRGCNCCEFEDSIMARLCCTGKGFGGDDDDAEFSANFESAGLP